MLGFARYLDKGKNRLTVVTDGLPDASSDQSVQGVRVIRVNTGGRWTKAVFRTQDPVLMHYLKVLWNMAWRFVSGTLNRNWARQAAGALEALHRETPVDVLISSYAPGETHLAALAFCDNHPEVRWIADMRDEMSSNPHLSSRERKELGVLEKNINRRADAVTAVSAPIVDDFRRLMPQVKYFLEVRNGYDHSVAVNPAFNKVFTMVYAGKFYGKGKPHTFFSGLQHFLKKHPVPVRIRFVGVHRNFPVPSRFKSFCEFLPAVSSEEAVKHMAAADANLLVLPKVNRPGVFSGKLFDYLSVRKPVIAVVDPSDVAADLIRELHAGFVADFDDTEGISMAIAGAYRLWLEKRHLATDAGQIRALHRREAVARLDDLIDKLTAK